jgi:hypothetical protein
MAPAAASAKPQGRNRAYETHKLASSSSRGMLTQQYHAMKDTYAHELDSSTLCTFSGSWGGAGGGGAGCCKSARAGKDRLATSKPTAVSHGNELSTSKLVSGDRGRQQRRQ